MRLGVDVRRVLGGASALATLVALVLVSAAAGQARLNHDRGARLAASGPGAGPATSDTTAIQAGTSGQGTSGASTAGSGGPTGSASTSTARAIAQAPNPGGPKVYDPGVSDREILVG